VPAKNSFPIPGRMTSVSTAGIPTDRREIQAFERP
jgi:hypothetical protein